jgi:hypothetical protein
MQEKAHTFTSGEWSMLEKIEKDGSQVAPLKFTYATIPDN